MQKTLKKHLFSGDDPTLISDFLARFVREADFRGVSETQAFIALPPFLTGFSESQYKAGVEMTRLEKGGVTCWREAVQ